MLSPSPDKNSIFIIPRSVRWQYKSSAYRGGRCHLQMLSWTAFKIHFDENLWKNLAHLYRILRTIIYFFCWVNLLHLHMVGGDKTVLAGQQLELKRMVIRHPKDTDVKKRGSLSHKKEDCRFQGPLS